MILIQLLIYFVIFPFHSGSFVDHYHEVNSYIVSELPTPMWHDVNVQPCLTCGTFADSIVEIDLWMSGGGSKSLLHKVKSYQLPVA